MDIKLRLESNGKTIEVGKSKPFRLLSIEGIETGDKEVVTTPNIMGDGETVSNKRIKSQHIMVEAEYVGSTKVEERRELISFFNVHNKGKLIVRMNDIERMIDYEIESFKCPLINTNDPLKFLAFLYCPIPFFRDIKNKTTELVSWIPNLEFIEDEGFWTEQTPNYWLETGEPFEGFISEFGTGEGMEFGYREMNQIVEVDNTGDVYCPIRVVFRADGDVVNPYIENMYTYELIRINKTLKMGDVLEITTGYGNKNVYLNGEKAHHYLDFLNSTWLQLSPGVSLIKYDAEYGLTNLECSISHTPQYLGV